MCGIKCEAQLGQRNVCSTKSATQKMQHKICRQSYNKKNSAKQSKVKYKITPPPIFFIIKKNFGNKCPKLQKMHNKSKKHILYLQNAH